MSFLILVIGILFLAVTLLGTWAWFDSNTTYDNFSDQLDTRGDLIICTMIAWLPLLCGYVWHDLLSAYTVPLREWWNEEVG